MSSKSNPTKELRPCFSCADKSADIAQLHLYIGALKKRIDLYEGTWFSPPQMKEERKKILRLEHCRDSLLEESRCQRLTIKAQSEALHKVYTEAELANRVREFPVIDSTNVFPLHHQTSQASASNCQGHGSYLPPIPAPVLSGYQPLVGGSSDPILAPVLVAPSAASIANNQMPSRKKKRPTRAAKNQKRRDAMAALEASLSVAQSTLKEISSSHVIPAKEIFRIVPADGIKYLADRRLPVDIDEVFADGEVF